MDGKRVMGTALAVAGGILLIVSALFLPTFSKLGLNERLVDFDEMSPEQQDSLAAQSSVTGLDVQGYLDDAVKTDDLGGYREPLSGMGLMMTFFTWLTVIFGLVVIILGIIGSRRVRGFGYTGITSGIIIVIIAMLIPFLSKDYVVVELGPAPFASIGAGVMIVIASFLLPKKKSAAQVEIEHDAERYDDVEPYDPELDEA